MATEWISPTWRMPTDTESPAGTGNNQSKFENYSLDFDGANYIDCGQITDLKSASAFSVSGWFKQTTLDQERVMFGTYISGTNIISCYTWSDGQMYIDVRNGVGTYGTFDYSTVVDAETWFHCAFVFDGTFTDGDPATQNAGRLKIYINGVEQTLTFVGNIPATTNATQGDFRIGSLESYTKEWLGSISEISVFNYALSLTQINYLWDNNAGGTTPNPQNPMAIAGNAPIAYYPLGGSSTGDAGTSPSTLTVPNNSVPSATVFDFNVPSGGSDRITLDQAITLTGNKTFSAWINLTMAQDAGGFMFFGEATTNYYLFIQGDYIYIRDASDFSFAQYTPGFSLNTWYHICISGDGTNLIPYVNGEPISGTYADREMQSENTIGSYSNGTFPYRGEMSNVQIWDTNLSGPEVTTLYNNGTPLLTGTQPQAANLKAWWKMNVDTSTWNGSDWIIEDSSVTSQIPNYTKALSKTGYGWNYSNCSNNTLSFDNSAKLTSSFWMKTTQTGIYGIALGVVGMGGLRYKTNQLNMARGANNYRNFGADTGFVNDGNWHHILLYSPGYAWLDIDSVRIFIDGIEYSVGGTGYTVTAPTWCVNSNIACVGTGCGSHGQGTLVASNVAVWESDQTSNISTIYNNGTPPLSYSTNPSLWWTLIDTSTSIGGGWYDSSGNGNDSGGIPNSPTVVDTNVLTIGNFGLSDGMTTANLVASDLTRSIPYSSYSMYFDAIDDEIELATAVRPVNVMTVSQWLKAPASGHGFGYSIATDGLNASWGGFSFYHASATSLQFQIQTASTPFLSTAINIDDNAWHHVVGVYDGVDIRIYLDGIDQGSPTAATGDITYDVTTHTEVMIGNYPTGNYDFNGNISNTAIWHRALTANEVLTVYNGGVPNDISSLAPFGWWSLAGDSYFDGTDWICPDLGSGGNNGTSSGMGGTELVGDGPGSTANGISTAMNIPANLKGNAPSSTNNAFSVNMDTQSRVAV
jgi:hypothetical protein